MNEILIYKAQLETLPKDVRDAINEYEAAGRVIRNYVSKLELEYTRNHRELLLQLEATAHGPLSRLLADRYGFLKEY